MALGDGVTWDETIPTDNTEAIYIDDHMRHLYKAVRSRMALEHEWPSSQTTTGEGGEHKFITFQSQASMPTITGTQVIGLYATSGNALVFASSGGTPIKIEGFVSGDIILSSNTAARTGWTLVSTNYVGKYLRIGSVAMTTGGNATHVHSAGTYTAPSHSHSGTTDQANQGNVSSGSDPDIVTTKPHTHTFTTNAGGNSAISGTSASANIDPVYLDVVAWQKD